jgi:hypothetical protein
MFDLYGRSLYICTLVGFKENEKIFALSKLDRFMQLEIFLMLWNALAYFGPVAVVGNY